MSAREPVFRGADIASPAYRNSLLSCICYRRNAAIRGADKGASMRISTILLTLLVWPTFAHAGVMEVRPDAPVAEFSIPDSWETSRVNRGIQAVSKDGEVDFWIEAYTPSEFDQILAEHNAYWKDQNVAISGKDTQEHEENGRKVIVTEDHATWKGKPTVLYYVEYQLGLPSKTNIVLTYWASPEGDKAFQKEVGDVVGSIKLTEK
jgi:hypothetical protein